MMDAAEKSILQFDHDPTALFVRHRAETQWNDFTACLKAPNSARSACRHVYCTNTNTALITSEWANVMCQWADRGAILLGDQIGRIC